MEVTGDKGGGAYDSPLGVGNERSKPNRVELALCVAAGSMNLPNLEVRSEPGRRRRRRGIRMGMRGAWPHFILLVLPRTFQESFAADLLSAETLGSEIFLDEHLGGNACVVCSWEP